jgi:hypothetical protein
MSHAKLPVTPGPCTAVLGLLALLLVADPTRGQIIIDTRSGGTSTSVPFGQIGEVPGNLIDDNKNGLIDENDPLMRNHTVGQSFTVPVGAAQLTQVQFFARDTFLNSGVGATDQAVNFRASVMAWDPVNLHPTGAMLYQSGVQSTTQDGNAQTLTFSGLGVAVAPGSQLVAFLTQEGFGMSSGNNIFSEVLTRDQAGGGTYAGGTLVTKTNGTESYVGLATEPWAVSPDRDGEFTASFSPVPEPGSLLLAASAAGVGGWVTYRRRRRQGSPACSGAT